MSQKLSVFAITVAVMLTCSMLGTPAGGQIRGGVYGGRGPNVSIDTSDQGNPNANQSTDQSVVDPASTQPTVEQLTAAAMQRLSSVQSRLKTAFQNSDDYKNALVDQKRAQSDLDRANRAAIAKLAANPDYRSALAARKSSDAAMSAARSDPSTPPDKIGTLAQTAMTNRSAVTRMESDAVAGDPACISAKAKLLASGTALAELGQKFTDEMKNDPDYIAAREQLDALHAPVNTTPVVPVTPPQSRPAVHPAPARPAATPVQPLKH